MPEDKAYRIQFSAVDLAGPIEARAEATESPGAVVKRDIQRYYGLLQWSMPFVLKNEAAAICEALSGFYLTEGQNPAEAFIDVQDACVHAGLAERFDLDRESFLAAARQWSPAQWLAVLDATERFWRAVSRGNQREAVEYLRADGSGKPWPQIEVEGGEVWRVCDELIFVDDLKAARAALSEDAFSWFQEHGRRASAADALRQRAFWLGYGIRETLGGNEDLRQALEDFANAR